MDVDILVGEVEKNVGVLLCHRHGAHLVLGSPACGKGGHASALESHLHVRHILVGREDAHPVGGEVGNGLGHEAQDDIDVVDHEVKHHPIILDPGPEGPQAASLDENGFLDDLLQLLDGAVEALHMAYVEDDLMLRRYGEELVGLLQVFRNRLLQKDVHAVSKELLGNGVMETGRHRDGD